MRASLSSIAGLGVAVGLLACGQVDVETPGPEAAAPERIEVLVPDLVDAIQAKQPGFVMDHVADSFKDDRGLDYFGVRSLVDTYAFHDATVGARLESVAITPAGNGEQRVVARVAFALGARLAPDGPLPQRAVTYAVDLVFARQGARWQAVRGSYRRE